MLSELSVRNMSLQSDPTFSLDKSEVATSLHFCVMKRNPRQQWESFVLSFLHSIFQFDVVHELHDLRHKQNTNFCRQHVLNLHVLVFFDSWDSSDSFLFWEPLLPVVLHLLRSQISTSSRSASMSSSIGARSVFRVSVGLTHALLCHARFQQAESCSQYWFLLTSLLCSSRQ